MLLALAGAVISGPLAAAAASPRDAGCTDCARDLIALDHDVALNALLARTGGQLAIAAGLLAVAWLAASLTGARRRRTLSPSPDLAADVAGAAFAAAIAAGTAVLLPADPPTRWPTARARRPTACFSSSRRPWPVPALRAARARRMVARAAVAVADDPGGSAVDALAAALGDPALRVAYPAPGGAWHDHRGQVVVLPERDVTMVTDAGEIVAALIHSSPVRIDQAR